MQSNQLKEELLAIKNNNYQLPDGMTDEQAVKRVITALGSSDGELRDDLAYTILLKWLLLEKQLLDGRQLNDLLWQAVSEEMLYFKIGESEKDSVFQRTFSSLLIALILVRDNKEHFLSKENYQVTLNRLIGYCKLEKDYRSFVPGKGWAHAPAHISDALDECVRSRFADLDTCTALWKEGFLKLLTNAPNVFDAEEDERIATPVIAMIELKKVPFSVIHEWLQEIDIDQLESQSEKPKVKRINFKQFIRCLYMRLKEKALIEKYEEKQLFILEHKFNPNFFDV